MDVDIQEMIDEVKVNNDAKNSIIVALTALFAKFQAAVAAAKSISPADRAAIQQSVAGMKATDAAIADAIVANTAADAPPA